MAYHGYIPFCKSFLDDIQHVPSFLEVGLDRGVTFIPLLTHLIRTRQRFVSIGLDIKVQETLKLTTMFLDRDEEHHVALLERNSLEVLPEMADSGVKFDLILLDGDHNYVTVSKELESIKKLMLPTTIVIIDDYAGRWATKDLWYSTRPGYEDVTHATQPVESEKHGVAPAVDDFVAANPELKLVQIIKNCEPIVMYDSRYLSLKGDVV